MLQEEEQEAVGSDSWEAGGLQPGSLVLMEREEENVKLGGWWEGG